VCTEFDIYVLIRIILPCSKPSTTKYDKPRIFPENTMTKRKGTKGQTTIYNCQNGISI
jgi:hypothetical protein